MPTEASLFVSEHQLPRHSLPRAAFREICAGVTSRETMAILMDAEYSRRRLLLRALVDTAAAAAVRPNPEPAWDLLVAVERRAPDVVRELILYPPFGVWLRRAIIRLYGPDDSDRDGHFGYLNTVAAAAAIRASVPCTLSLPVRHGAVVLPTVGLLRLPTSFPVGTAQLHHSGTRTEVTAIGGRVSVSLDPWRADEHFRPAPAHTVRAAGVELTVWIDDSDPYREFAQPTAPHETDPTELLEWRKLLDEAWGLLARQRPRWVDELAACVRTITPVDKHQFTAGFSSAAAIGAIAVPTGLSTTAMAETLVHEHQHSKLNALAHLVDLTDADATGVYYAPWRNDPRPASGMLHGLYAFIAVAEFWLARHDETDQHTAMRGFELAYRRQQLRWALDSLAAPADGLTDLGTALVGGIRDRLAMCEREPVAAELAAVAQRLILDHYAGWRLRNIRPDNDSVTALVSAWRRGLPAAPPQPGTFTSRPGRWSTRRVELLRARVVHPNAFAASVRAARRSSEPASHADVAYTRDDYDNALAAYLATGDRSDDTLVGIGLCLRAHGDTSAARALLTRPEIVAAISARLDADADPVAVASWLGRALGAIRVGAPDQRPPQASQLHRVGVAVRPDFLRGGDGGGMIVAELPLEPFQHLGMHLCRRRGSAEAGQVQ